jgi:very-short-patch-repair endonuclease
VLHQLFEQPDAMAEVAAKALEICHYDPVSGADLRRAENAREECEAACYDCLMSYSNQPDHAMLDRTLLVELLRSLAASTVTASPVGLPRAEHASQLAALCQSELERQWLAFVQRHNLRLPTAAQHRLAACSTVVDFYYQDERAVIYVDGYYHNLEGRQADDRRLTACLEDAGYTVVRFGTQPAQWEEIARKQEWLFGKALSRPLA